MTHKSSCSIKAVLSGGAVALLLGLPNPAAADEKVTLEQVPPAVRATIERYKGAGTIDEIERETEDGVPVYEVELEREGREIEFKIGQDGRVLGPDTTDRIENWLKGAAAAVTGKITLDQVPEPVRKTVEAELQKGGKLDEIDRETEEGRVIYEVEIERGDEEIELKIAENGTIVPDDDANVVTTGTPGRTSTVAPAATPVTATPVTATPITATPFATPVVR